MFVRSFSKLVADGQFGALGLILLSLVATINALVKLPGTTEEIVVQERLASGQAPLEAEEQMGAEDLGRPVLRLLAPLERSETGQAEDMEGQEVPAEPSEHQDLAAGTSIAGPKPHRIGVASALRQKPARKKKGSKGRNAIDDLFGDIG